MSDRPATDDLLALAREVAARASELVAERRRGTVVVADTKSTVVDVVTEADRAAEDLIRDALLRARPHDAVLGEEGGAAAGTSGVRWIVDPIDGTVNFLYGLPQYAVSIAAEVDGPGGPQVVAGVVRNPATGVEYAAALGQGATRDGVALRVREQVPLDQRLVGTGFGYEPAQRAIQGRAVAALLPRVRDIRRLGSCALDLCHVGEGLLDGYVEEGVNLWDHAAGGLVAREAGARTALVPGAGGRDVLVASPAAGFEEFLAAVVSCGFTSTAGE